jgi:hypothetical protein
MSERSPSAYPSYKPDPVTAWMAVTGSGLIPRKATWNHRYSLRNAAAAAHPLTGRGPQHRLWVPRQNDLATDNTSSQHLAPHAPLSVRLRGYSKRTGVRQPGLLCSHTGIRRAPVQLSLAYPNGGAMTDDHDAQQLEALDAREREQLEAVEELVTQIIGDKSARTMSEVGAQVRERLGDVDNSLIRAAVLRLLNANRIGAGATKEVPAAH